ncbi:MAG: biotin--[acetyl-CoA-carboxylase] ligase [Bacteroidota bacterium]
MPQDEVFQATIERSEYWRHIFLIEFSVGSQFDILLELSRASVPPPSGVVCVAGAGNSFHGFKDRPWVTMRGNLHMSVFLSPKIPIPRFDVGFMILATVSVIQTLDSFNGLRRRAMIRWVNDIVFDDAKVGGVLVATHSSGDIVTGAILGIGLNVETTPRVEPTPFVPQVSSLRDLVPPGGAPSRSEVLSRLLHLLDQNYHLLISGGHERLLDFYRTRSLVIGKEVHVFANTTDGKGMEMVRGRVKSIGDNLELIIDCVDTPIRKGRIVLSHHPVAAT